MGFFSSLINSREWAERQNQKHLESAKESFIALKKRRDPNRSLASIELEWEATMAPRQQREAREKELRDLDVKHWEDVAAGRVSKDTLPPSKAAFAALSPQEQQAETIRQQQVFQAQQIRSHNSQVEHITNQLNTNQALYGRNGNTVFLENELKKLTAQQPVFAPIGATPVINVNVATQTPSIPQASPIEIDDDELWSQAASELETGNRKEGLWIKCFSQSQGDENKAKALYYEARVKQLSQEANTTPNTPLEAPSNNFSETTKDGGEPLTELQKAIQSDTNSATQPLKAEASIVSNRVKMTEPLSEEISSPIVENQSNSKRNFIIGALVAVALVGSGAIYKSTLPTGISDLTKLNPDELKAFNQRLTAYTQRIDKLNEEEQAWREANVSFLAEKSAPLAMNITSRQLSDASYASPYERPKLKAFVEYRKTWNEQFSYASQQYQPLWINTNEQNRNTFKVLEKGVMNLQKLADGKITYGEYNRVRKENYQQSQIVSKEIDAKYPFPWK